MIRLIYSKPFLKSAQQLPKPTRKKLTYLIEMLQENPSHALLHTKRLSGEFAGFLSFRITRDWRVIFRFIDPTTIKLIRVAHRKDIYR